MHRLEDNECGLLLETLWSESITGLALVNEDGSFRRANPSFCRIVEYTEVELKKLKFQDITSPEDTAADVEMARLVAAGEYPGYEMTKSYITKTRRHQAVLLRVTGLWINDRFTYFVGEIAPLDSPLANRCLEASIHARARRQRLLKIIQENWHIITMLLAAAGVVLAKAIEILAATIKTLAIP